MTIDKSIPQFEKYKKIFEKYRSEDITESDTRSKLIDFLLREVLGWDESNIDREGHTQQGYYDYKIKIPGFHFVVEAKKNFDEFKLPNRNSHISINTLRNSNSEVIDQIRKYIFEENIQYGVVTNGHQFIIGRFINNDGTDWKKNKCLIFNGLNDIEERFIDFYNALSKQSISTNLSFKIEDAVSEIGHTLVSVVIDREKELVRNTLSSALAPTLNTVFTELYKYEVLDNKELIEACFIENNEIKKNQSEILRIFDDMPPHLDRVIPARNMDSISNQIAMEITEYPTTLKEIEPPKPIIIIGSKGAGKTTFINYLFKVQIAKIFDGKRPFIYLDFRRYTKEDILVKKDIIYRDILNYLYDSYPELELATQKTYKRIFLKEIKINDSTIWKDYKDQYHLPEYKAKYDSELAIFFKDSIKDVEKHVCLLSQYLIRERRIRLCVIFDNADQLDVEVQKESFIFSDSLIKKAYCNVIISLREGYYYKWRHHSPFDAYEPNVYHVSAPPYHEVLQKRISYALRKINIKGRSSGEFGKISYLTIDNHTVIDFLESIQKTIFGTDNSEMLRFLEHTTYPNIREGLDIFRHFLLSGHTDVGKYILRQHVDGNSKIPIPIWEFIKAVALDSKLYYQNDYSKIHNLLIPCEGSTQHFTKIKLLGYLSDFTTGNSKTERFVSITQICEVFIAAGYKAEILHNELQILLDYKLIESDTFISDTEDSNKLTSALNLSISLKGHYYYNEFISTFTYLDGCARHSNI